MVLAEYVTCTCHTNKTIITIIQRCGPDTIGLLTNCVYVVAEEASNFL